MAKTLKSLLVRRRPRQHLQEPPSPDREDSFELLERCPDIRWKRTLKANHQNLRYEIRVKDVLPGFHSFLTYVEYLRVEGSDKADNVDQVDQLVGILLTKKKREFEEFLVALWQQGYADSAARLADEAGVVLNTSSGMATAVDRDVSLASRAGIPKYHKDAMKEKNLLYYPLIESLHDAFYEGVIIPFESFVVKSTNVEFQRLMRICEKLIRRKEHPIACKVRLPTERLQFLHELQHEYGLWKDALEYQLLREVIMEFHNEGLTLRLEQYEVLLREKGSTILMQCRHEFRECPDLCLKLKADHNTALSTLCRLKTFLVNDVGLKDASFAGFREGCIELFFRISSESASTALEPLRSHAFQSKLLSMGVNRVTLSGHWVINTNTGHVVFLQSPESLEDHDTEDSTSDVTQSSEMTASIAGYSGRPSDLEDMPSCKRVKLNPEEEDTPVFQLSHSIEWQAAPVFQPSQNMERQAAQEDPYSSLLQSENCSCWSMLQQIPWKTEREPLLELVEAINRQPASMAICVCFLEETHKQRDQQVELDRKRTLQRQQAMELDETIWQTASIVQQELSKEEWYWGPVSKTVVQKALAGMKMGSFLVRDSSSNIGTYVLVVKLQGVVMIPIKANSRGWCLSDRSLHFASVVDLVMHYQKNSLKEVSTAVDITLTYPIKRAECQQMTLEVNGSESPMMNVHTRAKKEYYDLDCDGCVVADDLGPVDLRVLAMHIPSITPHWELVGHALDVGQTVLTIRGTERRPNSKCLCVLEAWVVAGKDVSWKKLFDVLRDLQLHDTVQRIRQSLQEE